MNLPEVKLTIAEQKRPNGRSMLTVRANGRYLGTLFVTPEEVVALTALVAEDGDSVYHPEFEWTVSGG